jgi:predicted RNase H-like HicB family nuclease
MKYAVTLEQAEGGEYVAECAELGLRASGLSPANALDSLRENIRYTIEWCPCSAVDDDYVQLDVQS